MVIGWCFQLKENCDNLLNLHIPEYNSIASEVKQLHSLSPPVRLTYVVKVFVLGIFSSTVPRNWSDYAHDVVRS